jgi:hypothetical protein
MNEEVNPRSLAFLAKDLSEHCRGLSSMPSGAGWPIIKKIHGDFHFDAKATAVTNPVIHSITDMLVL